VCVREREQENPKAREKARETWCAKIRQYNERERKREREREGLWLEYAFSVT